MNKPFMTYKEECESLRQQLARCQFALADTEALEMGTGEHCERLQQQLAECQAALVAKHQALGFASEIIGTSVDWDRRCDDRMDEIDKAISIQPDTAALREWGARLLRAFDDEVYSGNGRASLTVIEEFRSGEWTPEELL